MDWHTKERQMMHLGSYVEGGRLATDLLGTVAGYRLDDQMTTINDLESFGRDHGLEGQSPLRAVDVRAARILRGELARVVDAGSAAQAIAICSDLVASCPHSVSYLSQGQYPWAVVPAPGVGLVGQMQLATGLSLISIIDHLGIDRLRDCAHEPCTGKFVDTSSNGAIVKTCG